MIKSNTVLGINGVLSDGGIVGRSFSGFEARPQQVRMSCEVHKALIGSRQLVVEAGTGVGKSFAYLVPAIEAVSRGVGKILISTFTITLQEQLINKDLPFLAGCLPWNFNAVLAKGRGNYLCRRRLEFALRNCERRFSQFDDELSEISSWASETKDGSLSDTLFVPSSRVWDTVNSEQGNCPGRGCKHFANCFYRRARRKLESADIIVVNHALMFSDLVLKEQSVSLLPEYKYVIIDEAHNIEHVAEGQFGIDISSGRVKFLLDGLHAVGGRRGFLTHREEGQKCIDIVNRIRKESKFFFENVKKWYISNFKETKGRCPKSFIDDNLSGYLNQLRSELSLLSSKTEDIDERYEIIRFANRSAVLAKELEGFFSQEKEDYVYWSEVGSKKRSAVRLKSASLDIGEDIKRVLLDKYESVIMTSATLSSDGESGFKFFADRVGLVKFDELKLGSPFDYERQVTLYIEKDLPNPNDKDFVTCAVTAIKKYLLQTQGRAFVLFTSYEMLERMADEISGWLEKEGIELLRQSVSVDRGRLLRRFRKAKKSVLFGTESFWQGVDVPGEALSNVIIVRLPFAVPDKPLIAGKLELIKNKGGNPFKDYQLPSAVIKFKQGFGRLIRSKSDKGIVVVLDSRIINKRYGGMFLSAIPKCKVEVVRQK